MINVQVLLFGKPRELAGVSEESIELSDGASLAVLFVALGARHGPQLGSELASPERFMILVNGRHHNSLEGMRTSLADADVVAVLPAVIGG